MAEIDAEYVGGDLDGHAAAGARGKLIAERGSLRFGVTRFDAALVPVKAEITNITIPAEAIEGISIASRNEVRMLTRAFVGEAIGGAIGAVIGAASGKRNHLMAIACRREGVPYVVSFLVERQDGAWLLNAMQKGRVERGETPIPSIEDLAADRANSESERQTALLAEIRDLLRDQCAMLARALEVAERV